jgi:hypothetical protein
MFASQVVYCCVLIQSCLDFLLSNGATVVGHRHVMIELPAGRADLLQTNGGLVSVAGAPRNFIEMLPGRHCRGSES